MATKPTVVTKLLECFEQLSADISHVLVCTVLPCTYHVHQFIPILFLHSTGKPGDEARDVYMYVSLADIHHFWLTFFFSPSSNFCDC